MSNESAPGQAKKSPSATTPVPGAVILPDTINYITNPGGGLQQQQNYDNLPAGTYDKQSSVNGRDWVFNSTIIADGQTSFGVGIPFALNVAWRIVFVSA